MNYGTNKVTFGIGEVDIESQRDELWDKTRRLLGTGDIDIGVITR
jgi:hypothetical protein